MGKGGEDDNTHYAPNDVSFLASVAKNVEKLMATIEELDWQLSATKHIALKYKDLCMAQ